MTHILSRNKAALVEQTEAALGQLASACAAAWPDPDALDAQLARGIALVPACALLYVLDPQFQQISSNVSRVQTLPYLRGQSLQGRPFLAKRPDDNDLTVSDVYLTQQGLRPCITIFQPVRREALLGYLAADFDLQSLLMGSGTNFKAPDWAQYRGDPAIRATLFLQTRADSRLDERLDATLEEIRALMIHHGVFHAKLHFSSARMTLWQVDNPFAYRIHDVDEILDTDDCRTGYRRQLYPAQATVAPEDIARVFEQFKALRRIDETVYLRSASLNIVNGMIGLTFSCDGSHYLSINEFLSRDLAGWLGASAPCVIG